MKTLKLFALAAMAIATLSFVSCSDDDTIPVGPTIERAQKCRIEKFVLTLADGTTLAGDVYDYDKSIDIAFKTLQLAGLKEAYVSTLVLSEGATISPDPTQVADFSQPLEFTVTAADGVSKRTYVTCPIEKIVKYYTKITEIGRKGATELDADAIAKGSVGVSGSDLVLTDKIYDGKTLAPKGDLNKTGIPAELVLEWLANDDAGRLIGAYNPDGTQDSGNTKIYIWKEGATNAPELLLESTSNIGWQLSAAGNLLEGKGLVVAKGAPAPSGPYFCFEFTDGERSAYYGMETGIPGNDGSWSQMASPCSGDIAGTWFMWDPLPGGCNIYTWSDCPTGKGMNLIQLTGTTGTGPSGWGNYTYGALRAFTFNGKNYAATMTCGWPAAYFHVVDNENNFLMVSGETELPYPAGYRPTVTYVNNEKEMAGYIYIGIPGNEIRAWKLEMVEE